jgi:hypothetical protein
MMENFIELPPPLTAPAPTPNAAEEAGHWGQRADVVLHAHDITNTHATGIIIGQSNSALKFTNLSLKTQVRTLRKKDCCAEVKKVAWHGSLRCLKGRTKESERALKEKESLFEVCFIS